MQVQHARSRKALVLTMAVAALRPATMAHAGATLVSALSSWAAHPASTTATPVSGAITFFRDEIRITRR